MALDTEGRMWCALTQANTDVDVMILYPVSGTVVGPGDTGLAGKLHDTTG